MNFEKAALEQKTEKTLARQSQEDMQKIISSLGEESRYKREVVSNSDETIISPEGEKFSVGRIKDSSSQDVDKLFKFMERFNPEECDTADIIRDAIENPTDAYAYYIVKDKEGAVIAHTQGSYLEMETSTNKNNEEEAILFMGYTVTDKEYARKGLALECNRGVFKYAAEKAETKDQVLKAVVVEAVDASEPLANRLGMKRIYFEDNDGNIQEVPYICPPIQWDERSGKPLDPETGKIGDKDIKEYSAPEHLMVRMIDGRQEIAASELLAMIDPVYTDNYTLYRNEGEKYPTNKAIEYSRKAVKGFRDELEEALKSAKDGKIILLDAKEREARISEVFAKGKKFNELIIEREDGEYL